MHPPLLPESASRALHETGNVSESACLMLPLGSNTPLIAKGNNVVMLDNITEQKHARADFRNSEHYKRMLVENAEAVIAHATVGEKQ